MSAMPQPKVNSTVADRTQPAQLYFLLPESLLTIRPENGEKAKVKSVKATANKMSRISDSHLSVVSGSSVSVENSRGASAFVQLPHWTSASRGPSSGKVSAVKVQQRQRVLERHQSHVNVKATYVKKVLPGLLRTAGLASLLVLPYLF